MTIYYHRSPLALAPGSVIQPGNWGRLINMYQLPNMNLNQSLLLARELAFELVRSTRFSHLPSRLNASFAFLDLHQANANAPALSEGVLGSLLYEVELVNPAAPSHVGDFRQVDLIQGDAFLQLTLDRAERYWLGTPGATMEFITTSPLRVGELVQGIPRSFMPLPTAVSNNVAGIA